MECVTSEIKELPMAVKIKPPRKPSIVFLGETLSNNFCLPKFLPMIYAKLSFIQISAKTPMIFSGLYCPKLLAMSSKNNIPVLM